VATGDFGEKLTNVLGPVLGNVADTLSTALNRTVNVNLGEIQPTDIEALKAEFAEELVVGQAAFTEGISDEIHFLLQSGLTANLADLMLMGDGDKEFSAEEHLDGISELLNQIGGVICTYLSDLAGTSVKLNPVSASLDTVDTHAEKWESFLRVDLALEVEGFDPGQIVVQLSPQTAEDLQGLSPEDEQSLAGDEDRPPPAVLDDDLIDGISDMEPAPEVRSTSFDDFGPANGAGSGAPQSIEALMDLDLPVIIELGRTTMFIRDILELSPGSIVELNKLSGEPVDLYINDKRFARGEVVVIDENFGIRITDLVKVEDRIRSLR
jgi:flagellar motor switch protein FliN/FliY